MVARDDSVVAPVEFEVTCEVVVLGVVLTDRVEDGVAAAPLETDSALPETAGVGVVTNVAVRAGAGAA